MNKNYVLSILIGCLCFFSGKLIGQVTVTPATGGTSICVGGTSVTLGALTIKETANSDIGNGAQTYTLNAPSNFQFDITGVLSYGGTTTAITAILTPTYTSSTIVLTFTMTGTASQPDQLVINGIKMQAVTAPAFGNLISNSNSLGVSNTVNHANLFSVASPNVSIADDDADNIVCTGATITFTGYGASTYEFFVDGASVQGPSATSTYSKSWGTTAGSPHQVHVIGTSNGCFSQTSNTTISVNQTPTLTWNPSAQSFAIGDPDNILDNNGFPSGAPGGGTLSFSGSGVSFSGTNYEFSPSAAGAGSHTITGVYTQGTCPSPGINRTFVVSAPNTITGLNASYCINGSATFLSITPPAGKTLVRFEYYCYACSPGSYQPVSPANEFDPAYIGDPTRSGLYGARVRALYNDGTVSGDSYTTIYPQPLPSFDLIGNKCKNNPVVTLNLHPVDNGDAATTVYGAAGIAETPVGSGTWTFDPNASGIGPKTVYYQFKDQYTGCSNTYSESFQVYAPPTASITNVFSPGGYCFNSNPFSLTGSPAGGTFSGPGTFFNVFYPYYNTSVGNNQITYTYSDANGCSDFAQTNVVVNNSPSVTLRTVRGDTSVCVNAGGIGTVKFEASRTGQCTGVSWQAWDGSTFTTGGNAGSYSVTAPSGGAFNEAANFTNSVFQAGQGYARIQVVTTGQPVACPASTYPYGTFPAYLIPPPNVVITGLAKDKYCSTDPNISLTATANYKYPYSYALYNGSDASNSSINIASVPPGDPALVGKVFVPSSAATGGHQIRYSYTDLNGCSNFNDTVITINQNPIASFIVDSGRCATKYTYFDAAPSFIPPATTVTYTWDFGDGTSLADTSHIQKPKYIYPFPGGYPVSLTLLTNQGCSDTKALTGANLLTIQSIPVSDFDFKFQCFGDVTTFDTLSVIQAGAKKNRTWIFATNSGSVLSTQTQTTSIATIYTFPKPANYQVTMIDSTTLGCTDRKKKAVFILPYITPTVTSPYAISFKDSSGNWGQNGINSTWVHQVPNPANKPLMYYGGAGITDSVWVTSDSAPANLGDYSAGEKSSLNSPCINFSQLDKPMISLKLWTATQEQIAGAVLNTSIDNGLTWNTVGKLGDGIDWYNTIGIAGSPGNLSTNDGWSGLDTAWRQAKIGLPAYANYNPAQKVRFKITFGAPSDPAIARSEGIAIDSVWIGNKNKVVLMEHFTNNASDGSTTPAITVANNSMNTVRDTRKKDVAAVYYHTSFPAVDLFNAYFPAGPSSRVLYYGVTSSPRTVLDGTFYNGNVYVGGTPDSRIDVSDVDARSLETALFNLDMTSSFNPGVATVATKVTYNGTALFSNDLVLHTVITEDDSSGAVKYASVVRQMLPDAAGNYISRTWNKGDNISMGQSWNHSLPNTAVLGAVTFIQNASTKEIYQAAYLRGAGNYGGPVTTAVTDETEEFDVKMFPNPATDEVFFLYGKALRAASDWEIYDNIGRKVESGTCAVGREGFSVNTSNYSGGIYYIKLKGINGAVDHKELVVIH